MFQIVVCGNRLAREQVAHSVFTAGFSGLVLAQWRRRGGCR
jgi:hypothetical protein